MNDLLYALCPSLCIDVFLHCLQSSPEIGLLMGFDRVDRIHLKLREEFKKLIKIEIPFSYGEVLIHFSMIIVKVNLNQIPSKGFEPIGQGSFVKSESMVMARVETKAKVG
jgi:hypothetical protein